MREFSQSIGIHFGIFQLTTEGLDAPLRALEEALDARRIPRSEFSTLTSGGSLRLDKSTS